MKKIIGLSVILPIIALATNALAAPFTAGNIVVYRVSGDASGNTGATLTNRGNIVYLDEYTTNSGLSAAGTLVQSIMMPTNYFGANAPLVGSGSTFLNGLITRSVDGRFILVAGYASGTNQTFNLQSSPGTDVPRVIGLVDGNGVIDTTTVLTNVANGEELRAPTSSDGTNIWVSGSAGGVNYVPRTNIWFSGIGDKTNLVGGNLRQVNIFANQLYYDTFSNTNMVWTLTNNVPGTLPTSSNNVLAASLLGLTNNIPFFQAPGAFVAFKLKAGGADPLDTIYVADAGTNQSSGSIRKFSLVGGGWSNSGSIRSTASVGLAGQVRVVGSVTNVDLWIVQNVDATSGNNSIVSFTDSTGYNGAASGNANVGHIVFTSASGVDYRGVALVPTTTGDETFPSGPPNLSVGPLLDFISKSSTGCSGTETDQYSLANFGTTTLSWQATCPDFVSFSPASGSLPAGGSITVSAFFNASSASLPVGTNLTTITFTNLSGAGLGTQTRKVQLVVLDQDISPATDYTPAGQPNGPFSPLTNTYTVFNGSTTTTLILTNPPGANWLSFSATNVVMGPCSKTNISISVITNVANGFANGNFSSVIIFSNATAHTVIDTRNAQLSVGGLLFCDDFSTYTNGTLVPQSGWTAFGGSLNEPMVSNNAVYVGTVVGGFGSDEPFKNIPILSNTFVYAAMVMTVTSAPPLAGTTPSRAVCFFSGQNEAGYANHYLSARDTGTGTFVLCARGNSFTAYTFGATPLVYGTSYQVILKGETSISNTWVYLNPTSATEGANTPYIAWHTTDPGSTPSVGSVSIQNAFGGAQPTPGVAISKLCITTNFADAYNDVQSAGPPADPYATWQSQYFGGSGSPNAAGNADPDGDGMSNTNEFMAGFDPTNGTASVRILNIAKSGSDIVVTYRGANGNSTTVPPSASRTNVLEATAGTGNGSYATNGFASIGAGGTNVLSGGTGLGTVTTFTDVGGASGATKYYRVRVLVP